MVKNSVARSTFLTEIVALSFRVQTFEYIIFKNGKKHKTERPIAPSLIKTSLPTNDNVAVLGEIY